MSDEKAAPEPSMDEILASIRRILAEDERAAPPLPRSPRAPNDVLDLTEALNDDGTVRHIPRVADPPPERLRAALSAGRIEPVPPRRAGDDPKLVSDTVSSAVAASFARLASVPRGEGAASVDELVRETLRPMLQAWLDQHLPALVERLVRAEIARVIGATRPSAP